MHYLFFIYLFIFKHIYSQSANLASNGEFKGCLNGNVSNKFLYKQIKQKHVHTAKFPNNRQFKDFPRYNSQSK